MIFLFVCIDSVDIHSIEYIRNLMPVLTVSTCMHIWYGWKTLVLSSPKLLQIETFAD